MLISQIQCRLFRLMCVGDQAGNHINKKIMNAAMTRMGNLGNVLELVIDRFND